MSIIRKKITAPLSYVLLFSLAPCMMRAEEAKKAALPSKREVVETKTSTRDEKAQTLAELEEDDEDEDDEDEEDISQPSKGVSASAHYKSLALKAQELMESGAYNEAIPLIVSLLKTTAGQHISSHTTVPLDEMLTKALVFNPRGLQCKRAKSQFKKLTTSDTNAYAQAQGNVWLGIIRYLERGCGKNRAKAKKYFRRVLNLNANKRASAEARLALGVVYSFQKNPFSRKMLANKNFQQHTSLLRAQGMEYLKQAENQTDSKAVARYAKLLKGAITKDIKQAYLDFKLKTGAFKKIARNIRQVSRRTQPSARTIKKNVPAE